MHYMLGLSIGSTLRLPSITLQTRTSGYSPDLPIPITLFFLCSPELFPPLFYHIHLNPGFVFVCTVYQSVNGNEIINT
jgi:hypothetical protein